MLICCQIKYLTLSSQAAVSYLSLSYAQSFGHVQLFVTLWIVASQAPLSVGFSQQEYWSGLPFPRGLHDPGIEPTSSSPALAGRFSTIEPPGKPREVC